MKKISPILSANLLFLVTMFLVITLGTLVQLISFSLGLIATEGLFILLPTLIWLRLRHAPTRSALRLNPIRPGIAVLSLLLGIAVWLFSVLIEALMRQLTGMNAVPVPDNLLPKGILSSAFYFIAIAISAPICEEVLFRGLIQGVYEKYRSARFAIILTALMFAFYHLRLSGLPALLPLAFILGYVAWRTQSIYATMLIHFSVNSTSAINNLYAIRYGRGLPFLSIWTILGGVLATIVLIRLLNRLQNAPSPSTTETESGLLRSSWLAAYWPLIPAGLLYLIVAGSSAWIQYRSSQPAAQLEFYPPRVTHVIESRYQITDQGDDVVGDLTCQVAPHSDTISLDCTRRIQAYQVTIDRSTFSDVGSISNWTVIWSSQSFDLLDFSFDMQYDTGDSYRVVLQNHQLVSMQGDAIERVDLPEFALVEYEWPWRVNDLNADPGTSRRVVLGYLLKWDENGNKSLPTVEKETLREYAAESLHLPAGSFDAWQVTLGNQKVWYARNDPQYPRPVQFDDGALTYSLVK